MSHFLKRWLVGSPDKLQMQVDFLENHPDFSICFHPVMVHKEGAIENNDSTFPKNVKDTSFFEEPIVYKLHPYLFRLIYATMESNFLNGCMN